MLSHRVLVIPGDLMRGACVMSKVGLIVLQVRLISRLCVCIVFFFFFQAEDGIRDVAVTGVQTCALLIWRPMTIKVRGGRARLFGFHFGFQSTVTRCHLVFRRSGLMATLAVRAAPQAIPSARTSPVAALRAPRAVCGRRAAARLPVGDNPVRSFARLAQSAPALAIRSPRVGPPARAPPYRSGACGPWPEFHPPRARASHAAQASSRPHLRDRPASAAAAAGSRCNRRRTRATPHSPRRPTLG